MVLVMDKNRTPTRLAEILAEEGRTQSWLARKVGVTRGNAGQWMFVQGSHPSPVNRAAIAHALGRTEDEVFGQPEHQDRAA